MRPNIAEQARDRWPYIHAALGVDERYLRNRHMPCPGCGGKDRFRYDDKDGRGTFYCGGGGDPVFGDGFTLLQHVYGWDFKTTAKEVRSVLGVTTERMAPRPEHKKPSITGLRTGEYAQALWRAANRDDSYVGNHPYCQRKAIAGAFGAARGLASGRLVGRDADCVMVPQRTPDGEFIGVECINSQGVKQSFGKKGQLILGNTLDKSCAIYVVEGWADAVSTWLLFGNVIVVASFGKGRLDQVAEKLNSIRPGRDIYIVRDGDAH